MQGLSRRGGNYFHHGRDRKGGRMSCAGGRRFANGNDQFLGRIERFIAQMVGKRDRFL